MKKNAFILLLAGILLSVAACRKDPEPVVVNMPVEHVPDFDYTGKLHIHSAITFKSNFTENQKLTWYFGDKELMIDGTSVKHTFTETGTFKVTMASTEGKFIAVTKDITITNGLNRLDGKQKWYFLLSREKHGTPIGTIPPASFNGEFALVIVNDTTITIPDIPQMRLRGPYTVKKVEISAERMVFKSNDNLMEFSYTYSDFTAGIKITQVYKDTTWHLNGAANIID